MQAQLTPSRQIISLALASTAMAAASPTLAQAEAPDVTFEERAVVQEIPGAQPQSVEIEVERHEMRGPRHGANGGLGATPGLPYRAYRQGAGQPRAARYEESPGSTKQGWRVTPAVGNHRESATESIPPMACQGSPRTGSGKGERVR